MPDSMAFIPQSQSEYAFPASAGGDDEAAQAGERDQQIQSAFDSQRFQRGMAQNLSKALSNQAQ